LQCESSTSFTKLQDKFANPSCEIEKPSGHLTDAGYVSRPPERKFEIPRFSNSASLRYEQLLEASRLNDEWEDNVETKFAELEA
jgi:hypothetical protein